MSQPQPYDRLTNFTDFSAAKPTSQQSGASLDAEFNAIQQTLKQVRSRIAILQRDDGAQSNKSISVDQLADEVVLMLANSVFAIRGPWLTATAYVKGDLYSSGGGVYMVMVNHTSTSIAADRTAGKVVGPIFYASDQQITDLLALITANTGAGGIGTLTGQSVQIELDSRVVVMATRTAIKAAPVNRFNSISYKDGSAPGRNGTFTLRVGTPPADALEGLYIISNTAGFYWERDWDGRTGLPEWFGAVPNNPAIDNRGAIQSCMALCPTTQLGAKDYYVASTLYVGDYFRTLRGPTLAWDAQGHGARIVSNDASNHVVHIGGSTVTQYNDLVVENICAVHASTPTLAASLGATPRSWNIVGVTSGTFRNLSAFNPLVGFFANCTVACRWIDCRVYRSAIYGGPNDRFVGFWNYGALMPGMAGGNPSAHYLRCNASMSANNLAIANPGIGFYADAAFADTILDLFETSKVPFGIYFDGSGAAASNAHGDVRITNPTLDQGRGDGITVKNLKPLAKVQISGGYVQIVDNGAANKAILLKDGGGYITVDNLQITGEDTSATSGGIRVDNCPNVVVGPTTIIENIAYPADVINGCTRVRFLAQLQAGSCNSGGTRAALTVDNCSMSLFAPTISGPAGCWVTGVNMNGALSTRCTADLAMIDVGSVGGFRKLTVNGVNVTAPGFRKSDGTTGAHTDSGVDVRGFGS